MEAKEKGAVLDVEAEAFLAYVEYTVSYAKPLAITTTTTFEVSHKDAYDSDVNEGPHAAAAFMANLKQTSPSTREGSNNDTDFHVEVQTYDNHFFDNLNHQVSQEMHREEQLDSDVDSVIDDHDNTIPYHQYQLNNEVESVSTDVSSVLPGGIFVITILDDLRSQLAGHIKVNKEQSFANDSLKAELERYKTHVQNLEQKSNSNASSGAAVPEKPKVLAPGLYAMTPKYVPPQKRNNREVNTPSPRYEKVSSVKKPNVPVYMSTGIKSITEASKSKFKCETKTHRNLPARSENMKRVENPIIYLNKRNRVDSSFSVKRTGFISVSVFVCKTCNECLVFGNHDNAGSKWRPTGRKFTLGDTYPLTRFTKPEVVALEKSRSVSTSEPANNVNVTPRFSKKPLTGYKCKDRKIKDISTGSPPNAKTQAVNNPVNVVHIFIWYLDSGCSRHMTDDRSKLINYLEKFIGTIRFGNDQFAVIDGYGLELAFRKYTCYILNKDKVDLRKGSQTTNLYSISLKDMMEASPVFFLSKAFSTKSWLWHRRPIRVESINGKKYILVIVDDYTRSGWVRFLRTKDATPEVIKKFIILTYVINFGYLYTLQMDGSVGYEPTNKAYQIYNKRTHKIQETVHVTFDELTKGMTSIQPSTGLEPNSMAPGNNGKGPKANNLQSGRISSGLVTTPTTPSVPPTEKQLSELFQPLFDEDEEFPPDVHLHMVDVAPPRAPEIALDLPSMTTVTEDAPTTTTITSPSQTSPPDIGVEGPEHTITTSGSESFGNTITNEFDSKASSSSTVNVNPTQQNFPPIEHGQKWTKDHVSHKISKVLVIKYSRALYKLRELS
nr:hypothetical protein [Tanacetum cinerariifolium]